MFKQYFHAGLLAGLGLGLAASAQAGDADVGTLRHMSPSHARYWAQQHATPNKARVAVSGELDVVGPVLTRFDAAHAVNAALATTTVWADVKATDDLSGVQSVQAYAYGPSGQYVNIVFFDGLPSTKMSSRAGAYELSPFLEPGQYTFADAYVYDAAGNMTYYDANQLAALGNTTFTVKNNKGFDRTSPSLLAGKVLTRQVSLSAKQPGTENPAFIGLTLDVADNGDSVVAGIRYAYVIYCLKDNSSCFSLSSDLTNLPRQQGSLTLRVGGWLPVGGPPGKYHLQLVSIVDYAENEKTMRSSDFGGETDFSTYFPSTTITLNP